MYVKQQGLLEPVRDCIGSNSGGTADIIAVRPERVSFGMSSFFDEEKYRKGE